jgi:hypothetical protein
MTPRASATFLLLLALGASPAAAQQQQVRPPRALVRALFADLDEQEDFKINGIESLAAGTTVERPDLDGDGVGEWLVKATRFCGSNCQHWIYRRLPDGRFQQVYAGGGVTLDVLPARSRGWRSLIATWHMSCCETIYTLSQFDGRRYQWRDTEYRGESADHNPKVIYHLSIAAPDARGRRRLALDPMDAGGGLTIAARHDACPRGAQCGAPELVLRSARLPAGRVCVAFRAVDGDHREYRSTPGAGWCGVTTAGALADGAATRQLVLRPARRDWARMGPAYTAELTGPGLPGELGIDAVGALAGFVGHLGDVYTLPCDVCTSTAR